MEGFLNFLADHYIWFACISGFFAFALIGLVYESKKKKKEENKTADAVAQPLTAESTKIEADQPASGVIVEAPAASTEVVQEGTPSLEGLESNSDNFTANDINQVGENGTLVIEDSATPSAEPTLVIDDPAAAPSAEPSLVIEDPAAQPAPEAPVAPEAPAAPEAQPQTIGQPGQPPM